jgi:hypothetical protein
MSSLTGELRARIEAAVTPLHGWTTPDKACRLAELILETSAERSVEIGVFGGRGTIPMAMAHATLGHGYVVGIDPWEVAASLDGSNDPANDEWWRNVDHEAVFQSFLSALLQHHVLRFCRVMRERSATAVRLFADESVAVLHQDGNHSERISTLEVDIWAPKLARGGYWVADDTDWATTQGALKQLVERGFELIDDHGSWRTYRKP